jgi:ribosomal protein S12 methylthiotransferase accessory factor
VRPDGEQFLSETSNGCAVGGSLEEATLYGLFEALERDAFLLAWYGRLKLPAIDLHSTRDTSLRLAIEREERMTGFTFHAFDCTTDFGLPVVLAAGINRVNEAPRLIYGAAAHWDPDRALANAFYEAAAGIVGQRVRFPQELERGEQLVKDDSLVLSIEDHVLAGAMPSAFSRASFLFQDQPLQSMSERFASQYAEAPTGDLTEILSRLARRIIARGYDIVIINQTAPELRASDLYCVRVLVPGLMPMTFGHDFRRIYGLERLYRLPQELGYTERILSEADLNPYPHAFP